MASAASRRKGLVTLTGVPYVVWMLLFTIIPLGLVVWYAFTSYPDSAFTIDNFVGVLKYGKTFWKSIYLSFFATVICLVVGFPMGFIMSRMSERGQRTMQLLIMLPTWMSFLLRTYAWMTLLENEGLINKFFELLGIGPFQMINTQGAIILGMVYNYLPFMILPLYSIMAKIDQSIIEAAQDLGANAFHVLVKVIIPQAVPGIVTGITMVFVPAVSTFIISRMLGGGSNIMIGDLIDLQFLGNAYNPNLGSAISLVLMVLMLLCMSLMNELGDEEKEGMLL